MSIVDEGKIIDRASLISNRTFIESKTDVVPEGIYNEMMTFLQFEEYIMRKMMLIFNKSDTDLYSKMLDYYYDQMREYLKSYNIRLSRESLEMMNVTLDNQIYQAEFQKQKIVRRK